jgi:hypothetical protein
MPHKLLLRLAFTSCLFAPVTSHAADTVVAAGGIFGTISTGNDLSISDGDTFPSVFIVGKLGYDAVDSPWGWQGDASVDYSQLDWVRPKVTDQKGNATDIGGGLHLTYRPDSTSKVGVFLGYSNDSLHSKAKNGGTFTFYGLPGTVEGESTRRTGAVGVEGMQFLDENTWLQGRVALIDPLYASIEATDGVTTVKSTKHDVLGDILGGNAGLSLHHDFNANFYGHVFADVQHIENKSGSNSTGLSFGAGTKYTFDEVPISLFSSAGISSVRSGGETETGYGLSSGVIWRFGEPESGSNARLFRSVN